jgi:HEAT repeat protein
MLLFSLLAVGGVVITGQVVGRSLFLSALPPWAIPFRFVLPPLALVAAVALHGRAARRLTPSQLVTATFGPIAAAVVLARVLMPTPVGETLPFLLTLAVMLDAAGNVVMIVFWTVAGDVFDSREAKRLFGVISGGSVVASVAFGLFLGRLASAVRAADLLLIVVLAVLGCWAIVRRLNARHTREEAPAARPAAGSPVESGEGFVADVRYVFASPLTRTLAAALVVVALVGTIADYQLDLTLKSVYGGNAAGMVTFLSNFRVAAGAVGLFVQFAVAGRLMERWGVLAALLVLPASVAVGGVAGLVTGGALWAISLPRAADISFKYTLNDSAFNLLYLPLTSRQRARAKAVVDGTLKPVLAVLLGLAFLVVSRTGSTHVLPWTAPLILLAGIWVALLFRATRHYVDALSASLVMRRLDLGKGAVDLSDETSASVLRKALGERDGLRVLHTLAVARSASGADWSDLVAPLTGHEDAAVRAEAATYLAERGAARHAGRVRDLMNDPSESTRSAAIAAYCRLSGVSAVPDVVPRLGDASLATRGAAIVSLVRHGGLGGLLHAGKPLQDLLASPRPEERRHGADVLGELAVPGFFHPIQDLLRDPDVGVRTAALRAARSLAAPELIPALREALGDPGSRGAAVRALVASTAGDPARLAELARDAGLPSAARVGLVRALGSAGRPASSLLPALAEDEDERVRAAAYDAMLELRAEGHAPALSPDDLRTRLRAEIRAAFERRTALADLEPDSAHPLLLDALVSGIRRDQDRVLSLVALLYPRLALEPLRQAMSQSDARLRANAIELLDNVAQAEKDVLVPYVGGSATERQEAARHLGISSRPPQTHVERLLGGSDPWIRVCALASADPSVSPGLRNLLEAALSSKDPVEAETARHALGRPAGGAGPQKQGVIRMPLAPLEKVLFLKQVSLFREIPAEDVAALLPIAEEVSFQAGDVVIREGDTGDALYLIVEGTIGISTGGVATGKRLGSRDVIGELSILTGDPRTATCTAESEVLALRIHRDPFWQLMRERPEVPIGLVKILTGYVKK